HTDYWEAWQVKNGRVLKPLRPDLDGQDSFIIPDQRDLTPEKGTKTWGQWFVDGKMKYFRGHIQDIEKGRRGWSRNSQHAGSLMATDQKPNWWTDNDDEITHHTFAIWWNGIAKKKIPTGLRTVPPSPRPTNNPRAD